MSHVAVVDTVITDLEALKKAVKSLGLEWREGQKTYRWFGTWVKDYNSNDAAYKNGVDPKTYGKDSLHAIGIPGNDTSYEIGVIQNRDSDGNIKDGFRLVWDFWSGGHGLTAFVGNKDCGKLVAEYNKESLKAEASVNGYSVNEYTNEQGQIVLEMQEYA